MAASTMDTIPTCDDFLAFQELLKKMRRIDDNIIHALNTTIPTDSFTAKGNVTDQCKDLYKQLLQSYDKREQAIKTCITQSSEDVRSLKEKRTTDPDSIPLLKQLRKEQTKLRLMQNELNVEEVVKDRTLKVFYERCRSFYKPPDFKL
ncbi:protein MIX23 [Centruroides vittatus]|uniref:protein MIX23 n=1 Tax=Centruroides vittatus TaxID=120091 RepID=UPI00350FF74A